MDISAIILIVGSLSLGVLEISLSTGKTINHVNLKLAVKVAFLIVILHIPMLLIGWFSGEKLDVLITHYEHWIALGILILLGIKMIVESFVKRSSRKHKFSSITITMLLGMILTALFDALVMGISFALLNVNILFIIILAGVVLFSASILGIFSGRIIFKKSAIYIRTVGGLMLLLTVITALIKSPY